MDDARRAEIEQRPYDPRREERRKATRLAVPEDVDARMLDPDVRKELRSLTRESADLVARHLVMAGRLIDDDPEQALAHARAARAMAGRVGVVREAAGLAAYGAGEWAEALSELRTARRITGRPEHLGVMADCERALGRPERALAYADDPDVPRLPQDQRVELVIVLAGARRDLAQHDAGVLTLQDPARRTTAGRPWAARLWYAYADALLAAGRDDEARTWFSRVAEVDVDGATDAGDRLLDLDGVVLEDLDDTDAEDEQDLPDDAELAAYVAEAFPRPVTTDEGPATDVGVTAPGSEPTAVQGSAEAVERPDSAEPAVAEQPPTAGSDAVPSSPVEQPGDRRVDGPVDEHAAEPVAPQPVRPRSLMPQFASPPPVEDPDSDDD